MGTDPHRITDPHEPCRYCRGKGMLQYEEQEDGWTKVVWEHCEVCGGTGHRTVTIAQPGAHPGPVEMLAGALGYRT